MFCTRCTIGVCRRLQIRIVCHNGNGPRRASWSRPGSTPIHPLWNAGNGCKCSVKRKIIPSTLMRNVPIPRVAFLVRWGARGANHKVIVPTITAPTIPRRRNEFFSPTPPSTRQERNFKSLTPKNLLLNGNSLNTRQDYCPGISHVLRI